MDEIINHKLWNKSIWHSLIDPRRVISKILQYVARKILLPPSFRLKLQKLRGVKFLDPKTTFVGENVYFDEKFPQNISIGRNVYLTEGVKILTHFYSAKYAKHTFIKSTVIIEDDVFIGMNAVIASGVKIGKGAIIGANSVVTKDIPPNAIVGGVPAEHIGLRGSL